MEFTLGNLGVVHSINGGILLKCKRWLGGTTISTGEFITLAFPSPSILVCPCDAQQTRFNTSFISSPSPSIEIHGAILLDPFA